MSIPPKVLELITRFRDGEASFKSSNYHESDLRSEFLDPFFKALGWDIDNEQSAPEGLKEVVREARLTVHDSLRAPDYSFWLGGTRRFFVEAKKPAVNLQNDSSPAFQVRRYGWSGKLPTSIVTDFEEFVIYDCRTEPLKTDSATNSRLLYIRYTEYEDRWDEIANLFSKEAVLAGKLDSYIGKLKVQKGTSTVDTVFLAEISTWRQKLADDMARRNPTLSQRDLNYAVQMTIDRIVFLRISEDRGIEP